MRFQELPAALRPNSEAAGNTRSDAGNTINKDLLTTVIERWRSASMSHRTAEDDGVPDYGSPLDTPTLAPAAPMAPAAPLPPPPSSRGEALRSSLLKRPLDAGTLGGGPASPPGYPPRRF
jgi:hypothetical protein